MFFIKNRLYKSIGQYFDINIITSDNLNDDTTLKTQIHQTIGNYDIFEWIGEGATSKKIPLFFETEEDFIAFKLFALGNQMTLVTSERNVIVNITGSISVVRTQFGHYTANVEFTTARDPSQTTDFDINIFSYDVGSKKSLFTKLQAFSNKVMSFVGNVNEKVGNFINTIELATATIGSTVEALASSQSILTTPLSSIQRAGSNIVGAISTATQTLNNVAFIIKTTPSNISSVFTGISSATESLFEAIVAATPGASLLMNCTFGCDIINSIYNKNFNDGVFGSSQNAVELTQQNEVVKVLFMSSLMASLEDKMTEIENISSANLEYYKTSFEKAHSYVNSSTIVDADLRWQNELLKIRFFRTYNALYSKATKTFEVDVEIPTSLHKIVYSVNGNFDFLDETMQLNNIVNVGFVSGKILVLSNA